MYESKYSNVLTVILVVVIIAIIGLLGFLAYDVYKKYDITEDTGKMVEEFQNSVASSGDSEQEENTLPSNVTNPMELLGDSNGASESASSSSNSKVTTEKPQYKGFNMIGTIEIPKTKVKLPVLEDVTKKSIETSVAKLYGPGLNEVGNTVIVGHNYRNGLFFSNNKKLAVGDIIYITDLTGQRLQYEIYNMYTTTPEDAEYMNRDTNGAREISLSTCTDDSQGRIIIWAKEKI